MAALAIQRQLLSGAYVPCWKTLRLRDASGRISYQRTPECRPEPEPTSIVWFTTMASCSPKLRYASRYMSRSASDSSFCVVPPCGMQSPRARVEQDDV